MQPSTWNERNQHWIPQFLLKGFGTKGNASTVYELDKQTKKIRLAPVDDVASKEHLHTFTRTPMTSWLGALKRAPHGQSKRFAKDT